MVRLGRSTAFLVLILSACSHNGYLLGTNNTDDQRAPASAAVIDIGAFNITSPCSPLRQSMKQETMRVDFMRCNVVLNGKLSAESNFEVREADLCFAVSEFMDSNHEMRTHAELRGTLEKVVDSKQSIFKNIKVYASRFSDQAFRHPSGLEFSVNKNEIKVEDISPLSSAHQTAVYNPETQNLRFQVTNEQNIFLGLSSTQVDSLHTNFKCTPDFISN